MCNFGPRCSGQNLDNGKSTIVTKRYSWLSNGPTISIDTSNQVVLGNGDIVIGCDALCVRLMMIVMMRWWWCCVRLAI